MKQTTSKLLSQSFLLNSTHSSTLNTSSSGVGGGGGGCRVSSNSMTRRELHKVMNQLKRDKKFTFKPSLTPLTERLAMSAKIQQ